MDKEISSVLEKATIPWLVTVNTKSQTHNYKKYLKIKWILIWPIVCDFLIIILPWVGFNACECLPINETLNRVIDLDYTLPEEESSIKWN